MKGNVTIVSEGHGDNSKIFVDGIQVSCSSVDISMVPNEPVKIKLGVFGNTLLINGSLDQQVSKAQKSRYRGFRVPKRVRL